MSVADLLDKPKAAGEIASGIFRDPLFKHREMMTDDGLAIVTSTRFSGRGGAKQIGVTLVENEAEGHAFVKAFDQAALHYMTDRTTGLYGAKLDSATGQAVLTDAVKSKADKLVPGDVEFAIEPFKKDALGDTTNRTVGMVGNEGTRIHEEGKHFQSIGAQSLRAARENQAHRAEATIMAETGYAALPLQNAATVISEFNKSERRSDSKPSTGRQLGNKEDPVGEHEARFSFGRGRLDIKSDPADPAGASWSYKEQKWQPDGQYDFVEQESGPLTIESLQGLMKNKAADPTNVQSFEIRAEKMRRATFADDAEGVIKHKANPPEMPSTADGLAEVQTPATGAAAGLTAWRNKGQANDVAPEVDQRNVARLQI
ncbi:MAG: hypothetical protein AAF213_09085 [Pseudomonadota bacterium]